MASSVRERSPSPGVAVVCAMCVAVSLPLIFVGSQVGDEFYHYPLAVAFSSGFPLFSDAYSSAYTPLPYVLVGGVMRVLGTGLWLARLVNLGVGVLGILGFHRLAQTLTGRGSIWPAVFLAFSPYYLRNCSVFYVGNYALVCVFWAFLVLWRGGRRSDPLLVGALLGAATLCGQWALAIAGAVGIFDLATVVSSRTNASRRRTAWARMAAVALFQAPSLAIFFVWRGFTPPAFFPYQLALSPTHVTGALAVFGFTFAVWALSRFRNTSQTRLAVGLLAIPLCLFALPDVSSYQGPTRFTGLTAQIIGAASSAARLDSSVLFAPVVAIGLVMFAILADALREQPLLGLSTLLLFATYSFSVILGETHMTMAVALVFLLIYSRYPCDLWLKLSIVQSSALGVAYTVYHSLLKFAA